MTRGKRGKVAFLSDWFKIHVLYFDWIVGTVTRQSVVILDYPS